MIPVAAWRLHTQFGVINTSDAVWQSDEFIVSKEEAQRYRYNDPTQLIKKTNQFNLTSRRYMRAEVEAVTQDPSFILLYGRLTVWCPS